MRTKGLPWVAAACVVAILAGRAYAQTAPRHYLSNATSNSTLVYSASALLGSILAVNTNATTYYLKFYNKATAPVCGTDTPVWTLPLPQSAAVGPAVSLIFPAGVGFCITGGIADSDASGAATGIAVNLGLSGR